MTPSRAAFTRAAVLLVEADPVLLARAKEIARETKRGRPAGSKAPLLRGECPHCRRVVAGTAEAGGVKIRSHALNGGVCWGSGATVSIVR